MDQEKLLRKHFNLQNGEKCFIIDNKIIISSDYKINPDHYPITDGKISNIRKLRVSLNILYTIIIFSLTFVIGIYPLIMLMFLVIWDLNQLNRYRYKVSNSNCIPIDKIKKIELRKGGFGFNFIDVIFEANEESVMRPLKLYDSDEEFELAIKSFQGLGFLTNESHKIARGTKIKGVLFKANNRTEIVFSDTGLFFTKDGLFDKNEKDYYTNNNIIVYSVLIIQITLFIYQAVKLTSISRDLVDSGITLLVLIALSALIPLKFLNRSNSNYIDYASMESFKKLDNYHMRIVFRKGKLKLKRKFPVLHFGDFSKIIELLEDKTGKKALK